MDSNAFTPDVLNLLLRIVKRGNCAEVKKEQNKIVVVEIERHVRSKTTI